MSSHHIVRENQEPALLIQNLSSLPFEILGQLLEWSPTIIVNDDSLDHLLSQNIKVDVVFSTHPHQTSIQENLKIFPLQGDFIEAALKYLIQENHTAVNIVCDTIPNNLEVFAPKINMVLLCQKKRYLFVQTKFEKWKPQGDYIYVEERHLKSFQGLHRTDKNIFQVVNDGFISLEFNSNSFIFIGEDI